jgi:RNA-directed DNA polymerase
MGIAQFFSRFFSSPDSGLGADELARRLKMTPEALRAATVSYHEFSIPKRSGSLRAICAPDPEGKALQRLILHRVLGRLRVHPAVEGFEHGHSIVTNARRHKGKAVVVNLDIRDFFDSTSAKRLDAYFKAIGWNREARQILLSLCTRKGGLPQGAPTSPRLSNLVNFRLDARLTGLAVKASADYSRYADDITFSFANNDAAAIRRFIAAAAGIIADEGYRVHRRRKLHVWGRHNRQVVTGLVVNNGVNLPRDTRRWLRSVEHHLRTGRPATLSGPQLSGWRALAKMIASQRDGASAKTPQPRR